MSCFIVSAENIRQQSKFISTILNSEQKALTLYNMYGAPETTREAFKDCIQGFKYDEHMIYRKLYIMNLKAYNGRYKECVKEFDRYQETKSPASKVTLYKHMQCYIYQCSEEPVDGTPFYNAIVDLKNALASSIISDLPEYDAAEWK